MLGDGGVFGDPLRKEAKGSRTGREDLDPLLGACGANYSKGLIVPLGLAAAGFTTSSARAAAPVKTINTLSGLAPSFISEASKKRVDGT